MTCTCRCHPSVNWTAASVPNWVHMADVPPTDEEPWTPADADESRGTWLGCLVLLSVIVLAFLAGRLTS